MPPLVCLPSIPRGMVRDGPIRWILAIIPAWEDCPTCHCLRLIAQPQELTGDAFRAGPIFHLSKPFFTEVELREHLRELPWPEPAKLDDPRLNTVALLRVLVESGLAQLLSSRPFPND